jgi:hypothetical protein
MRWRPWPRVPRSTVRSTKAPTASNHLGSHRPIQVGWDALLWSRLPTDAVRHPDLSPRPIALVHQQAGGRGRRRRSHPSEGFVRLIACRLSQCRESNREPPPPACPVASRRKPRRPVSAGESSNAKPTSVTPSMVAGSIPPFSCFMMPPVSRTGLSLSQSHSGAERGCCCGIRRFSTRLRRGDRVLRRIVGVDPG